MDVFEARRINLAAIKDARFGGSITALAKAIGQSHSYTSRLLTDNPTHRKRLGESARDIEKRLGLPRYSLDQDPDAPLESPATLNEPSPSYLVGLSPAIQSLIDAALNAERAGVTSRTIAHFTAILRAMGHHPYPEKEA